MNSNFNIPVNNEVKTIDKAQLNSINTIWVLCLIFSLILSLMLSFIWMSADDYRNRMNYWDSTLGQMVFDQDVQTEFINFLIGWFSTYGVLFIIFFSIILSLLIKHFKKYKNENRVNWVACFFFAYWVGFFMSIFLLLYNKSQAKLNNNAQMVRQRIWQDKPVYPQQPTNNITPTNQSNIDNKKDDDIDKTLEKIKKEIDY